MTVAVRKAKKHQMTSEAIRNVIMLMMKAVKLASPTTLDKQTVLFSPPPRQLEPLPTTAETQGSLLIKDCLHPK